MVLARLLYVHMHLLTIEITRQGHRLLILLLLAMSLKMHDNFLTDLILELILKHRRAFVDGAEI